jgi:hypothetical protein
MLLCAAGDTHGAPSSASDGGSPSSVTVGSGAVATSTRVAPARWWRFSASPTSPNTRWATPIGPVLPTYIPGRFRTASSRVRTTRSLAVYTRSDIPPPADSSYPAL